MEPVVGSWWRTSQARGQVFRYDGRTPKGAYRFTKFAEDRETILSCIEIFNLEPMEPLETE